MSNRGASVRKALSLTFMQSGLALVFNLASVTIVSRLLTPAEVGVYSVAVALVTLVHMLRDFGVSELIVQERNLTDEVVRTAFTMNLIIGWTLAAAVFGFSGLIGAFYGDPGVTRVTKVLALVFVLMPFGTTTLAYMRREMQFSLLVGLRIAETAVRSSATIALAYLGFSYMSMAWASVAAMAVLVLGSVLFGGRHRVRGLGFAQWRRVLHFGSNRTITDVVSQIGGQSANIVIGRMLGMSAAGLYSRGNGIVRLTRTRIVGAIGSVAFPAYAREQRQNNAAPLLFRRSLVYLTGVCWPFFTFCALMAYPLIRIAFGPQWIAAVPIMRWLCVAAVVGTLIYQCSNLLTAIGHYRAVTKIVLQYQTFRIALVVLAAFHSLEAIAASQVVANLVAAILYYRELGRYHALRFRPLLVALAPSAALTVAANIVPAAVFVFWPGPVSQHYVPAFLVAAAGAGGGWLAAVFLLKHPLSLEIRNAVSMLGKRWRPAPKAR